MDEDVVLENPEMLLLRQNKEGGYNYRERRHDQWDENYTLYRDTVIINRLIQRQTVNVPLMKQTVRTLLKDVDDMPVLYFENLDNDKQAEVFKNEYWNVTAENNVMELQDIVDKKQVFLFGRSFDQWQVVDGKVKMTIQDPMDILVDRYTDPTDLNTSRFLIHTHIFVPLSSLEKNPDYDMEAVKRLKNWYATESGIIKVSDNKQMLEEKNQKMRDMGLIDVDSPVLGETYVELSLHFLFKSESKEEEEEIYLYVEADDMEILMKKKLEDIIDPNRRCKDRFWRNHYPYNSWAEDLERQDFWSDGVGDVVRQPNKLLNAWFSQLAENRTLRNFGMHYYNSSIEGFTPGSFNPVAWGWYGIPVPAGGRIGDVLQKVDIPDLSESLDEMNFVMTMLEKATGATATQQGAVIQKQVTLGEVELALGEAKERVKGMSKFYTRAWKQRGLMFIKLVEASADQLDAVKVYKKGKNTDNLYSREINPNDWMTTSGYRCKVWSQEEKASKDTDQIQKLNVLKGAMPMNQKLGEIYKRKLLEFADLPPEDVNLIMEEEKNMMEKVLMNPPMGGAGIVGQAIPTSPTGGQQPNRLTTPAYT